MRETISGERCVPDRQFTSPPSDLKFGMESATEADGGRHLHEHERGLLRQLLIHRLAKPHMLNFRQY